jgi:tripartite-type tricarboxylate transporter receptor subunit TctC
MLALPDIKEQLISSGTEIDWLGPQQFPDFVKPELVKWTAMIKEAGSSRSELSPLCR